jgi:putative ABC transport system permease protein
MILRHGCWLTVLGVITGLGGALILCRIMSSQIHGVLTIDVSTLTLVSLVVAFTSVVATIIPAHRTTRVNPIIVLKYD